MVARSEKEFSILSDSGYSREILRSKTESTVTEETNIQTGTMKHTEIVITVTRVSSITINMRGKNVNNWGNTQKEL